MKLILPESLKALLAARYRTAKDTAPAALSTDGTALLVDGGLGYGAYISPEGEAFMETYDLSDDSPVVVDRSEHAQVMALVLGSTRIPELSVLLPSRPTSALSCTTCGGRGWRPVGHHVDVYVCHACAGLGWQGNAGAGDGGRT